MTEEAVRRRFRGFIDDVADYIEGGVDPSNVVRVPAAIPDRAFEAAARPIVRREISEVGDAFRRKFDTVVDAAADGDPAAHVDRYVEADVFYNNYTGDDDTAEEFRDALVTRFASLVDAARPMVVSGEDEFWRAVRDGYPDEEEALRALQGNFRYAETIEAYRDDVELEVSLELGPARRSIDYTEEALRVLEGGEKSLREKVEEGVRGTY